MFNRLRGRDKQSGSSKTGKSTKPAASRSGSSTGSKSTSGSKAGGDPASPPTRQMSYNEWRDWLGPAVPLGKVMPLLKITKEELVHAIRVRKMVVHEFRAGDEVSRFVRMSDLQSYGANPLLKPGMIQAMGQVLEKWIKDDEQRKAA